MVKEGDVLEVEHQSEKPVVDVLLVSDGSTIEIGTPFVKDVKVKVSVTGEKRGRKIRISRFKSKSRYRKVNGYRDSISILKVESIGEKSSSKIETTQAAPAVVEVKEAPKKAPAKTKVAKATSAKVSTKKGKETAPRPSKKAK